MDGLKGVYERPVAALEGSAASDFLEVMREQFRTVEEAENQYRTQAVEDLRFRAGDQWDGAARRQRKNEGRPCLTVNRVPQFVRQVTNSMRQNRPSMRVSPVDDRADIKTAEILQGLFRNIEYLSSADIAYDVACDSQVTHGLGYFRFVTQYATPYTFDLDLRILPVRNPLLILMDPARSMPDGSDAKYAFAIDTMKRAQFLRLYPHSKLAQAADWETVGANAPGWMRADAVRIAEYFTVEFEREMLCLLSTGQSVLKGAIGDEWGYDPAMIVDERVTFIPRVVRRVVTATEILSADVWPGPYIPIVPVPGDELDIEGEMHRSGLVRDSMDSQRMVNFLSSLEAEIIAMTPRSPWIGAEGQFEGHEEEFATAHLVNRPYLEYRPTSLNGQPVAAPSRQLYEPPIQAVAGALGQWVDNYKAQTAVYDASLGNRSNETSGVAIRRRQAQSDIAHFHFSDNFRRSLRHGGRILLEATPHVYTGERIARIIGADGKEESIWFNREFERDGEKVLYRTDVGRYDITIDAGPSYETKRQEALDMMLSLTQAVPQAMGSALDLVVRNSDAPGAQEIADRLKKQLPPELQDEKQKPDDVPPAIRAQMQQLGALVERMTGEIHALSAKVEDRAEERESKERIEMAKLRTQLAIEFAKIEGKEAQLVLGREMAALDKRLQLLDVDQPVDAGGSGEQARPSMLMGPEQVPNDGAASGPVARPIPVEAESLSEALLPRDGMTLGADDGAEFEEDLV